MSRGNKVGHQVRAGLWELKGLEGPAYWARNCEQGYAPLHAHCLHHHRLVSDAVTCLMAYTFLWNNRLKTSLKNNNAHVCCSEPNDDIQSFFKIIAWQYK